MKTSYFLFSLMISLTIPNSSYTITPFEKAQNHKNELNKLALDCINGKATKKDLDILFAKYKEKYGDRYSYREKSGDHHYSIQTYRNPNQFIFFALVKHANTQEKAREMLKNAQKQGFDLNIELMNQAVKSRNISLVQILYTEHKIPLQIEHYKEVLSEYSSCALHHLEQKTEQYRQMLSTLFELNSEIPANYNFFKTLLFNCDDFSILQRAHKSVVKKNPIDHNLLWEISKYPFLYHATPGYTQEQVQEWKAKKKERFIEAQKMRIKKIEWLLDQGYDPTKPDKKGKTFWEKIITKQEHGEHEHSARGFWTYKIPISKKIFIKSCLKKRKTLMTQEEQDTIEILAQRETDKCCDKNHKISPPECSWFERFVEIKNYCSRAKKIEELIKKNRSNIKNKKTPAQ